EDLISLLMSKNQVDSSIIHKFIQMNNKNLDIMDIEKIKEQIKGKSIEEVFGIIKETAKDNKVSENPIDKDNKLMNIKLNEKEKNRIKQINTEKIISEMKGKSAE
ncbi:MAG: hypothetical protein ACRDD7_02545, partial [Peptostreptococcaceae bacterium]